MIEVSIRVYDGDPPTREIQALQIRNRGTHPDHPDRGDYVADYTDGRRVLLRDFERARGAEALLADVLAAGCQERPPARD